MDYDPYEDAQVPEYTEELTEAERDPFWMRAVQWCAVAAVIILTVLLIAIQLLR